MLYIVTSTDTAGFTSELDQAFRLRHKVFVEEKGWTDLRNEDGRETDRFDNEHAVHMLYIDDDGRVLGYQRMLPTTEPHLLSEVTPQLCEGERPVGTHIWEWTRYCVEAGHRERGRILSPVANALLSGIVEWGLATWPVSRQLVQSLGLVVCDAVPAIAGAGNYVIEQLTGRSSHPAVYALAQALREAAATDRAAVANSL